MPYSNCLSVEQALYFELFDDIKYEWLKEVLDPKMDRDEYDFEVEIEDIPNDENTENYKTTQFTFELRKIDYIRFGETHYKTKTFVVNKTYAYNSPYAMSLGNQYEDTDDEEDEEDEEEEKSQAELKCPHPKVDEEDNLCHDCFHKTCEEDECWCWNPIHDGALGKRRQTSIGERPVCEECDEPKMCTADQCYCDPDVNDAVL